MEFTGMHRLAVLRPALLLTFLASFATAPAFGGDVTGTIYRDFDGDAVLDAEEVGVEGIEVETFDASGSLGTTTTAADGSFTAPGGLPGETIRLEIHRPASMDYLKPGLSGADSVTFLSFVTMPADNSDSTGNDVALANPGQHCQADPSLVVNCFINGDQSGTGDVLVSFPNTATNNTPAVGDEALANQLGTTWGLAYQRSSDTLFASSFQKRHAGYLDGTADGTGAIYAIVDPDDGTATGISTFLNLNTLFGTAVAGVNPHPTGSDFDIDAASYAVIGKVSFGDLDISEDELTLWVVNLADRRLYEIPLGTDPANPVAPSTSGEVDRHDLFDLFDCDGDGNADTSADVDLRPFALKVHDGLVYVGAVCSGESTQDTADLRALVWSFDPDTDTFTNVLDFAGMTYARGLNIVGCTGGAADWQFWEDTYPAAGQQQICTFAGDPELSYTQPILADIEFDAGGTMYLGLRDRFGDQQGFQIEDPDGNLATGDGFGDLLRATPNGLGQWVVSAVEATAGTEFFADDDWTDTSFTHNETSFGGLALRPGNGEVVYSRMDPIDGTFGGENDFAAGVRWADTGTGATNNQYEVYDPDTGIVDIFGKGNGLGDVEAICEVPPLELGDRLWCDDGNGIQDPGEAGLSGITVTLVCDTDGDSLVGSGGDLTATTTTDGSGGYLFDDGNVAGGIPLLTACELRVERVAVNGSCGTVTVATTADADASTFGELRDSDGALLTTGAFNEFSDTVGLAFTTGTMGSSDHALDFGFTPAPGTETGALEIEKTSIPTGPLAPGESFTYQITISNNSQITHTGIELYDDLPPGVTSIAQSTSVTGPRLFQVRDRFETASFANQDGRDDWAADWVEDDTSGAGPSAGNVTISGGSLLLDDQPDSGTEPSLAREVDLSAFDIATLEFGFATGSGVDAGDEITVEASSNGGGAYTTLEVISGITGATVGTRSYDLSGFIAANTRVRLRVSNTYGGADEFFQVDDLRITAYAATDVLRVTEYFLGTGDFTGTSYDLTLGQALSANYFVIVQGSDGDGSNNNDRGPDENYARLVADPFGTGELATSSAADQITLQRDASVNSWVGVVSVVECLADCSNNGFQLLDVRSVNHTGTSVSGSDTSAVAWSDIGQTMLLGGFNGAGCETGEGSTANTKTCHARIFPSGSDTIEWTRETTGATLSDATSTVMVLEWGSAWTVERAQVTGTNGGDGLNAVGEYNTAAIGSVLRDQTWVWGTGHTDDQGIGDASEGVIITLGDGVNQNVTETTVAVGAEDAGTAVDFEVYALSHPSLAVDYRFKADGDSGVVTFDVTVDSASTDRMALSYNGQSGTGNAYPRPMFSARYLNDTTVRLERRRSGQNFPAWVQGIDFSGVAIVAPQTVDNDPVSGNPQLLDGSSPNLLSPGDGFQLAPGESLTVTYDVLVDNPLPAGVTGFTCPATADSNEGLPVSDSTYNPVGLAGIIGDFVWFDLDGDGNQDAGEPGIDGAVVILHSGLSCAGPVLETTTTANGGFYLFDGLPAGDYCVELYEPSLPDGYSLTSSGNPLTTTLGAGATDATLDFGYDSSECLPALDFETDGAGNGILSGQVIDSEYSAYGVTISATGGSGQAMIFDSNNPTGGDTDLGAPNTEFGGPGVGTGGEAGELFENRFVLGNVLILSTDGDSNDPDDHDGGGTFTLTFDRDLRVEEIGFLDSGDTVGVDGGEIRLRDSGGVQIGAAVIVPGVGDNGTATVTGIGGTGVRSVEVELFGAGAIESFTFCAAPELEGSLGDRVWLDLDGDGQQDIGEPGLANVEVTLWDAGADLMVGGGDDVALATQLTDASGLYLFTNLAARTYYVDVTDATVPTGLSISPGSTDPGALVALASGATDLDSDFGYYNASASDAVIGDTVWSDADTDGLLDPGESGIAGVTLDLISAGADGIFGTGDDSVTDTATTDASGRYLFAGVTPGKYRVDVTDTGAVLTGYTLTTGPQSNTDPSPAIVVEAGDVYLEADFGYDNPSLFSITDTLWLDPDADGIFDGGETPLSGVTVALLDSAGDVVATAVSNASGDVMFDGLSNGDYTLSVTDTSGVLANLATTTAPAAAAELAVTISGADVSNESFGYRRPGVVGDRVWNDADGDGLQDADEIGIPGVTVELYFDVNGNGVLDVGSDTLVATDITDAFGLYLFDRLFPGTYFVSIDDTQGALTGYTGTTADSQAAAGDQLDATLALSTDSDLTRDFGYQNTALPDISGNVFEDIDRDGVDDGVVDPGIVGVTLGLFDSSGNLIATTTTDSNGDYSFPDLPAGDYTVAVTDTDLVLDDFLLTSGLDAIDVTVVATDITGIDFGYARTTDNASIGDFVWLDGNDDGIQDGAEPGLAGIDLDLYDAGPDGALGGGDDVLVASTTTGGDGFYLFEGLSAGTYYVDVVNATVPTGLGLSTGSSDPSALVSLAEGENYREADFGYSGSGGSALGDFVWYDADSDGNQDPGEVGLAGVTVNLLDDMGTPITSTVTDASGRYLFTGLSAADYQVEVDVSTLPAGLSTTPTNIGNTLQTVTLDGLVDYLFADWGFDGGTVGSIGDTVFLDTDGDGTQGVGEGGIEGVTLDLLDSMGDAIATTVTDENGNYDFVGLFAGNYQVQVTDTGGVLADLNLSAGLNPTATIALAAGQDYDLADFGYSPSGGVGTIGNLVWRDLDGSGDVNAGEPGVEGVTLELWVDLNTDGVITPGIDNLVRSATTDVNGEYEFNSLPSGAYLVTVTDEFGVLTGFTKTSGTAGVDDNSQADPYAVTLTGGAPDNLTADFGYNAAADLTIAGTTFFDLDGDGAYEPSMLPSDREDFGVEEVTVFLFRDLDGDGVLDPGEPVIDQQPSDSAGDYLFTNLPPGDYIVGVDATGTFVDGAAQTTQLLTSSVQLVALVAVNSVDNDFGWNRPATAVVLSDFRAFRGEEGVMVEWSTAAQANSVAFRLVRHSRGQLVPVGGLLPVLASAPQGATYRLADPGASDGEALVYTLVEMERGGFDQIYGPFTVAVEDESSPVEMLNLGDGYYAAPHAPRAVPVLDAAPGANKKNDPPEALGLRVRETGLYRLSAEEIAAGLEISAGEVESAIREGLIDLRRDGQIVTWLAEEPLGSGIYFVGHAIDSLFTDTNVYRLALAQGLPMATLDGGNGAAQPVLGQTFTERLHLEENVFAATFAAIDPEVDYWHWAGVFAGHPTLGSALFDFDLPYHRNAEGELELRLKGASDSGIEGEHSVLVELNGAALGETSWSGLEVHTATFPVAEEALLPTGNQLKITGVLAPEVPQSLFYVDAFDVGYQRLFQAEDDVLRARSEGQRVVTLGNFGGEDIEIFDITSADRPLRVQGANITPTFQGYQASLFVGGDARELLALRRSDARTPELVSIVPTRLLQPENHAEYLVIAPASLRSAAEELAMLRQERFTTRVVALEDVLNEVSGGLFHPEALRDFLAYAHGQWVTPPRFVLLVGAGTYDYRDLLGLGGNLLPPTMVATPYGLYASDNRLADFDNDGVPELAIGRLPAVSVTEVMAYGDKLSRFEDEAADAPWRSNALFLADDADVGGAFANNSAELLATLDTEFTTELVDLATLGLEDSRARLFAALGEGLGLLTYNGHGGLDRFASEGLLTTDDVPGLANDPHLPLVLSLTCNVSRFEVPGFTSLGSNLVLNSDGGAAAVIAPTGLSLESEAQRLGLALADALAASGDGTTVGELFLELLNEYTSEDHYRFIAQVYQLLGDPATVYGAP